MTNTSQIASRDHEEWDAVKENTRDAVSSVGHAASHATSAVADIANQAASGLGKRVDDLSASAGHQIKELGANLQANGLKSGLLGDASQSVAQRVKDVGSYIEKSMLSGMCSDTTRLIQRNPLKTVSLAIGMGWMLGRLLRRPT